jgi:DNA-binding winged helix-turn-helix (wHTH) protein
VLLGGDAPLDAVDQRFIEAMRGFGYRAPRLLLEGRGADWEAGWGLDERQTMVWLAGRSVDLSSKLLLWQLLIALVEAGGELDKENLVQRVWNTSEYHPLRHDGRMHTAVRKLRREIEDDPKDPRRFITLEDGYKLVGPVRCIAADR